MIVITPKAISQFKKKFVEKNIQQYVVRLAVKSGGCNGYLYQIIFENVVEYENDIVFDVDGIRFIVDNKSFVFLSECKVIWSKSLINMGFQFENLNEESRCGCGHSFTVKQ